MLGVSVRDTTFLYEYEAPAEPVLAELKDGEVAIDVPEKPNVTSVTVLTYENGMTFYAFREPWDWGAAQRLAEAATQFLKGEAEFFGVLPSSHPDKGYVMLPRRTIAHLLNIHDNNVESPLAKPDMRGQRIIVPGPGDIVLSHGPGKRKRR